MAVREAKYSAFIKAVVLSAFRKYGYRPQVPSADELQGIIDRMGEAVEAVGRVVHDQWAAGRLAEGWRYGPERNDQAKTHPQLVPYTLLEESEQQYDIRTAAVAIWALERAGYQLVNKGDSADGNT